MYGGYIYSAIKRQHCFFVCFFNRLMLCVCFTLFACIRKSHLSSENLDIKPFHYLNNLLKWHSHGHPSTIFRSLQSLWFFFLFLFIENHRATSNFFAVKPGKWHLLTCVKIIVSSNIFTATSFSYLRTLV